MSNHVPDELLSALRRKDYAALDKLLTPENVNGTDKFNTPLLFLAVSADDADTRTVKFLISKGADVNAQYGAEKWTALYYACHTLRLDRARALLDGGADPNIPNGAGDTPLSAVVTAPNPRVFFIKALAEKGADPDIAGASGSAREQAERIGQSHLFGNFDSYRPKRKRSGTKKKK